MQKISTALLGNAYPKLEYCAQYRETDFNFICRLMEQAGIYFFFQQKNRPPNKLAPPALRYIQCHNRNTAMCWYHNPPQKIANKKSNYAILSWQILSVMVRSATILSIHATMNDDFLDDNVRNMYHGWVGKGFHPNSPSGGGGPGFFMPAEQFGIRLMRPDSLPHPYSPAGAALTPNQIKQKVTEPEPIKLTDLPGVMRKKGWVVGAAVMEKWLAGAVRKMTPEEKKGITKADRYPPEFVDKTLVKWKWLVAFQLVRDSKAKLIERLTVNNDRTLNELRGMMQRKSSGASNSGIPTLSIIGIADLVVRNLKDSTGADLGTLTIHGILNKNRLKLLHADATKDFLTKSENAIKSNAAVKDAKANKSLAADTLAKISAVAKKNTAEAQAANLAKIKYESIFGLFEEVTMTDFVKRKGIKNING